MLPACATREAGRRAGGPARLRTEKAVMVVKGRRFERKRIVLGGHHYHDCTFVGCELVFDGRPMHLLDNHFEDCSSVFEGAAGVTLDFLVALSCEHPEMRAVLARKLGLHEPVPTMPAVLSIRH
jgi:hypothetical protein